ncbi:SusC/RagA family TonB-linked outer membrane protein [Flavobacterium sp. MAH-1]|uniref:SusC/RagA family TonB-linked outer membrane protein n=1 Tax=Flavobacterium agri TaxID=2743471 RepID=A0A7Y9C808_9FLAO|nr:SusC/RagA family TonB-linked outer membrane protein [Flavobacterium agri]NUY81903.1 SusC/RagA family TonB-linked outer membrane protein [Flavobacterium agri]NYA71927.1 SusC/RagA family TonB-linked outer membrane protein [Flavobacterium agri]
MKNFSLRKATLLLLSLHAAGHVSATATELRIPYTPNSPQQPAQQTLTGTVHDTRGPLPGVTVAVKSRNTATVTDASGRFSIDATTGYTLVFSFVGYKTQEITLAAHTQLTVTLEEDATALQNVVVNAGYYTVKEKERTGSIVRVTASDIGKQPIANPLAALQGRMAGVNVTQTTGVPGGGFDIKIRGTNSLRNDGNAPLYIVDGMPYLASNQGNPTLYAGILTTGGSSALNGINPSDIESIEILKDADATAIYGSRGANGVVLITTKKGKAGKTKFSLNSWTGAGVVNNRLDLLNTEQYIAMRLEGYANDGITEIPEYDYDVNGTWSLTRYTDWQKKLIGGTAMRRNIDAAFSGGNAQTQFVLRGTTYNEGTVFPGDWSYRKSAVHAAIGHRSLDERFTLSFASNYVADKNDLLATDLSAQALQLAPNAPELYNPDGTLNWENSTWENPLRLLEQTYANKTRTLTANTVLGYKLLPLLEARVSTGYATTQGEETRLTPHTIYDPAFGLTSAASTSLRSDSRQYSFNIEPQLEWKKEGGFGKVSVLAGATFQENTASQLGVYGRGFANNALMSNLAAATRVTVLYDTDSEYRYNAVFGRVNYALQDRYFLNLTGRRDGSSRFGPGRQYANFGAVGAAWLWGKEAAVGTLIPALSFGKLRASYGSTGSDQIGDYQFLDTYGTSPFSYNNTVGLAPVRLYNPNFSWETNKKLEVAADIGFLDDRIFASAAWYKNRSSSQLVGLPLPGTTGFTSVQANLGATVENRGWEFELRTVNLKGKDFAWETSWNLSLPKNELVRFPELESSTYANRYVVGQPVNIVKVYDYVGLDPETGLYTFRDYNGDGATSSAGDRKKIVQTGAKYFGGVQNSLSYKKLRLDFLFQFVKQIGQNYLVGAYQPGNYGNQPTDVLHHWQQPGDTSGVQAYSAGYDDVSALAYARYGVSDAAYTDASYIRLKNLSLSYTLPELLTKSVGCRIYAQGQNLLTITQYKGRDPENQSIYALPPLRVITFGIDLSL